VLYPPSKRADITFVAEMPAERRKTMSADERLFDFPALGVKEGPQCALERTRLPATSSIFPLSFFFAAFAHFCHR